MTFNRQWWLSALLQMREGVVLQRLVVVALSRTRSAIARMLGRECLTRSSTRATVGHGSVLGQGNRVNNRERPRQGLWVNPDRAG